MVLPLFRTVSPDSWIYLQAGLSRALNLLNTEFVRQDLPKQLTKLVNTHHDKGVTPLLKALEWGMADHVTVLLSFEALPLQPYGAASDLRGQTPLITAADHADVRAISSLLQRALPTRGLSPLGSQVEEITKGLLHAFACSSRQLPEMELVTQLLSELCARQVNAGPSVLPPSSCWPLAGMYVSLAWTAVPQSCW